MMMMMQRNCSGRMMNRWVVGRAGLSTTSPGMAHEQKSTEELMDAVRSTYRTLFRLVHRLPSAKEREKSLSQLRTEYRTQNESEESSASSTRSTTSSLLAHQIHEAGKKIAYLRIMTPKDRRVHDGAVEQWIYKADGSKVPLKESNSQSSNANRVVSNWHGKNMDPCMVNRHKAGLRRAGFVNNLHAKGMF